MTDTPSEKDVFDALGIQKPEEAKAEPSKEKAEESKPAEPVFDANKFMATEFGAIKAELAAIKDMVAKMQAVPAPAPAPSPVPAPAAETQKAEEKLEAPVPEVPQSAPKEKAEFSGSFNFREIGKLVGNIGYAKEE